MISAQSKNPFVKEVLLALLILGNCMILPLHLLVNDELNSINISRYTYVHGYLSNQEFVWNLLSHIQVLIYAVVFLFFSQGRYRHALHGLVYWTSYRLLICLTPMAILDSIRPILQLSALMSVLALATVLANIEKRKIYRFQFSSSKHDLILAHILLSLPLLHRISYDLPLNTEEINVLGFTITNMGFLNVDMLFTYLFYKSFLVIPLFILFLKTKRWWKYALLIPIILTVFQIKTAFNPNLEDVDAYEFFEAAPFLFLVLVLLLFLSNSAYYQSKIKELYQRTYHHLEMVLRNRFKRREIFLSETRDRFQRLKNSKNSQEEELYQLKKSLEQELQKHGS